MRTILLGVALMVAFVFATNFWEEGISPDAREYERIADAAPGLPDEEIGSAFTERFVSPWISGSLGELLPGGSRTGLWIIVAACAIAIVALLVSICGQLGLGPVAVILCLGLIVLNPYLFRAFSQDPGPVDPLFVTGIAIVIWALVIQRFGYLLVGALVAILGRQSALLAIPAATAWLYAGEGWRSRPTRDRLLLSGTVVGAVILVYGGLKLAVSSFTFPFSPSIPGDTVLPVVGDPGSLSELGSQAARVAAPLVLVVGCIAGVLVGLARARGQVRLPVEFWCAALIGLAIVVQPLLISPDFEGFYGNQARLSALGVFPLCVALAYALRAADARLEAAPRWALAIGVIGLCAASLNDRASIVGPRTNGEFLVIQVLVAALLAWLLARQIGSPRGAPVKTRHADALPR